jgi:adenylate kinase family enzyme
MDRIAIVGSPGSGKSTLAREIARATGLPVLHLDRYYWRPGWVETAQAQWKVHHRELIAGESWIMDGTYINSLADRLERVDTVIVFEVSKWRCLFRVLRRTLANHGREVQARGCPERFDLEFVLFVWRFPTATRPRIEEAISRSAGSFRVLRIKDAHELSGQL